MLETARQYALELLHGLSECISRDDLVKLIICDWTINSGCEYDNQCCDPVACCIPSSPSGVPGQPGGPGIPDVVSCTSFSFELVETIYNGEPQNCNISIQEI